MHYVSFNGRIVPEDEPLLLLNDRSYRYGDGLFETCKIYKGRILLEDLHFARLQRSIALLDYETPAHFSIEKLRSEILLLAEKNRCTDLARVRLSLSAGNGGLLEDGREFHYAIECWPLTKEVNEFNTNGLVLGISRDAVKTTDRFANLKSASFLPYALAARAARKNKWNDALLLNSFGRVADSSIANVFLIKDGRIKTPALSEGCVDGVLRRWLLEKLPAWNYKVEETTVSTAELVNADEVFLTNSVRGIRWVGALEEKMYSYALTSEIFQRYSQTIFQ